jgi:hypothetical protein
MYRNLMIINQSLQIRVLELQLRGSPTVGGSIAAELRSHLAELKARVDVLDRTLDQCGCEQEHQYAPAGLPVGEGVWC